MKKLWNWKFGVILISASLLIWSLWYAFAMKTMFGCIIAGIVYVPMLTIIFVMSYDLFENSRK